jgi:transcriptional regulator with XRE-family HTH domain
MVTEAEKRRVGALIRHRRHVLGLDQPGLARLIGVSRQTVSKWECAESYPQRHAGKVEAVLSLSLSPELEMPQDYDPGDPREADIASWPDVPADWRQEQIHRLRAARALSSRRTA